MEYGLGMDPASGAPSSNELGLTFGNGGATSATFTRPTDRIGLTYVLEISSDLQTWTELGSPAVTNNGDGTETVEFAGLQNAPGLSSDLGFARLRIDSSNPVGTAYSPVHGWYELQIKTGHQSFGISLVKPVAHAATVTGTTATSLLFVENTIAASLDPQQKYYVEITSGTAEGHRFAVDLANSSGGQIAIDFDDRTTTASSFPSGVSQAKAVIRPQHLLGEAFDKTQFQGGTSSSLADRILFFGDDGYESYYYLKFNAFDQWVRGGDSNLEDQHNLPIRPGEGCFFIRRGPDRIVKITGEVRANAFIQPLRQGYNLVAEPTPIIRSPVQRNMTPANGFVGGPNSNSSDQFTIWKGDLVQGEEGFNVFYRISHNAFQYWTELGNNTIPNENDSLHFHFRNAVFINRFNAPLPGYRIDKGW
ncbi:MAG: hypothetical protein HKN23_19010, partial [Verrucomicrobiales bacterium]|nr:hypothetical protein [Verrucomicrobiales bacterium]